MLLALAACAPDPVPPGETTTETPPADTAEDTTEPVELVSDIAWLARLSIDLTGRRPSLGDIARVQEDPAAFETIIDEYLATPDFADRMAWIWNDTIHTAVWASEYDRFGVLTFDQWRAMGQEPLQLVRAIVDEDRPFTDLVTSTEILANPDLAELWGLTYTGGLDEWARTTYTDGRPMAGVLSSTTFWNRYLGDSTNVNRRRANAIAATFLCADFFDRESSFSLTVDVSSLTDIEQAVRTEPECLSCHASLDPLAGFLGGFAEKSQSEPIGQFTTWSPEQADWYAALTPPGYFGHPGATLVDLGAMMAADARFSNCAARRFAEGLLGDTVDEAGPLGDALRAEGLVIRPFVRAVVTSEAYRADDERVVTNEQLHSIVSDLLGWDVGTTENEGLKPLSWSVDHRLLGGGTDDVAILTRNRAPGVGLHVLLEWLGRQAAAPALDQEIVRPMEQRVFVTLSEELPTDEAAVREQIASWNTRFLTEPVAADSPEVDRLYALWTEAEDPWVEVLAVLLRHPRAVIY